MNQPASTNGIGGVAKYNPHLLSPQELKSIFVARKSELNWLFDTIKNSEPGECNQHCLIVGQRGMGKTTLLRRVGLMVEEDAELSQSWLALNFPEEQYTVSNCGELWSNVVGSLADTLEARHLSTQELDRQLMALDSCAKEQQEEKALSIIDDYCARHNTRLLLLIDSTDMLLENLRGRKSQNHSDQDNNLWRLRNVLQNNCNIFWLGASYKALELDNQYKDSFQDFFHPIELSPMNLKDMQAAMETLAATFGIGGGVKGEQAVEHIRQAMTHRPERLKTLRHLTGGIPRTTVKLYELFAASDSNNVRQDLERLLDDMTPLYKARLEAMADQPRKIFAHIMEHWNPISIADLSAVSGLQSSKLSSQLNRLELEGFIVKTSLPNTKVKGNAAAERFFNIWYLMRNAPRRLKLRLSWLVEFLRMWYQHEELENIAKRQLSHIRFNSGNMSELEYSRALAASMPKGNSLRGELDMETYTQLKSKNINLAEFYDLQGEDKSFASLQDYQDNFNQFKEQLEKANIPIDRKKANYLKELLLINVDLTLPQKQNLLDKLVSPDNGHAQGFRKTKEKAPQQDPEEVLAELESQSPYLNLSDEQAKELKHLVTSQNFCLDFVSDDISSIQLKQHCQSQPIYWDLLFKWQHQLSPAITIDLLEFALLNATPISSNVNTTQLTTLICNTEVKHDLRARLISHLSQSLTDIPLLFDALEKLLQQKADKALLKILVEQMQTSLVDHWHWYDLGYLLLTNAVLIEHALVAFKKVLELDENNSYAWNALGNIYKNFQQKYQEAEQAYKKAIESDKDYALPWNGLGNLYQDHLGKYLEAEQAYKNAIESDKDNALPWNGLGNLYQDHLGKYIEAEQAYKKAIESDEGNALLWNNLGNLYQYHLGKFIEAEQAYKNALELDENYDMPWNGLGNLYLSHQKKYTEAEQLFLKSVSLDSQNIMAFANLARCQWLVEKHQEANESFQKVVELSTGSDYKNALVQAHLMLGNYGLAQAALETLAEDANLGNQRAFFQIKEQCWEMQQLGKGLELANLMASCSFADYLKPFEIALRYCNGDAETIKGFAAEIKELALDIVADIEKQLPEDP